VVRTFEEWHIEARELIDVGPDQAIAIVRDRARAKGSKAEIDNEFAHLWTLRDGLIIRFDAFRSERKPSKPRGCGRGVRRGSRDRHLACLAC